MVMVLELLWKNRVICAHLKKKKQHNDEKWDYFKVRHLCSPKNWHEDRTAFL